MSVNGHGCPRCGALHSSPASPAAAPASASSARFRGARVVQVLDVVTSEGLGTSADPWRYVVRYVNPAGGVLAVFDPLLDEERVRP